MCPGSWREEGRRQIPFQPCILFIQLQDNVCMHQTNCSINKNRVNSAGEKDTGGKKKKEPRGRQRGIDYTESGERGFCSWLPAGALTFGPSRTPAHRNTHSSVPPGPGGSSSVMGGAGCAAQHSTVMQIPPLLLPAHTRLVSTLHSTSGDHFQLNVLLICFPLCAKKQLASPYPEHAG